MEVENYFCNFLSHEIQIAILVISMFVLFVSSFLVFFNRDDSQVENTFMYNFFGEFIILLTGKYLNKSGKKWRIAFLVSISISLLLIMLKCDS